MFRRSIAGRYRTESLLGSGTFGTVYLCEDRESGDKLAVKVIEKSVDESAFKEYSTLKRLKHPNVVRVFDVGRAEGYSYITMEYVSGVTLVKYLEDLPSLTDALRCASQLFSALAYLERERVLHQDVKPSNCYVELRPAGHRVKLLDFGLASRHHGVVGHGTVDFMAPEVLAPEIWLRDGPPDHRADLFGAGAVLYLALTGRYLTGRTVPLATHERKAMLEAFRAGIQPIATHRPDMPRPLQTIIMRLLAIERSERYASAYEVRDELQRAFPESEGDSVSGDEESTGHDYLDVSGAREDVMSLHDAGVSAVLLVEGRVGQGKTKLLHELGPRLSNRGVEVIHCNFARSGDLSRSPHVRVPRRFASKRSGREEESLAARYPSLLGGATVESSAEATEEQMLALLREGLQEGPVAVLVDDAQWADDTFHPFVRASRRIAVDDAATGRREGGHLLVVASVELESDAPRLDEIRSLLAEARTQPIIALPEFSRDQIRSWLLVNMGEWAGSTDQLVEELESRTGGVPGEIVEAIAEYEEGGIIDRRQRRVDSQRLGNAASREQRGAEAVLSRVRELPLHAATVLQAIAVFDQRPVTATELHRVTDLSLDEITIALALLEPRFLRRADVQYRFRATSQRDAVYGAIETPVRRVLHRRIAQYLEERYEGSMDGRYPEVARHWARSDDAETGRTSALSAARDLAGRSQHLLALPHFADAIGLYRERVAAPGATDADRRSLAVASLEHARSLLAVGEPATALPQIQGLVDSCRALLEGTGDRVLRGRHAAVSAEVETFRWRLVEGERRADADQLTRSIEREVKEIEGEETREALEVRADLLRQLGFLYRRQERHEEAAAALRECLDLTRSLGRPVNRVMTALAYSTAAMGASEGIEIAQRASATAADEGDVQGQAEARQGVAFALTRHNRADSAVVEYEEALRLAESPAVGGTKQAEIQFFFAELLAAIGQSTRGLELARQALRRFEDGEGSMGARVHFVAARCLYRLCRHPEAVEHLSRTRAYTRKRLDLRQNRDLDAQAQLYEGRLLVELGRYAEGLAALRAGVDELRPPGSGQSARHFAAATGLMSVADVHVREGWIEFLAGRDTAPAGERLQSVCAEIASMYPAENATTMGLRACAAAFAGRGRDAWRPAADELSEPRYNLYQAYGALYASMGAIVAGQPEAADRILGCCRRMIRNPQGADDDDPRKLELTDARIYLEGIQMVSYLRQGRDVALARRHRKELAKVMMGVLTLLPKEEDADRFEEEPFRAAFMREAERLGR